MLVNNPIHNACNYAVDSEYLSPPDSEQVRRGVVPLDSLPADWWNFFIKDASDGINEAQRAIQDYISEVKTLTTAAKIPENQECKDRIFCAIDVLRQTIATASLAGAVKSSDIKGQVSVNSETGIMTANGVGNVEFTNMGAISGTGTKSYGTVTEAIRGTREETISVFTTVKGDINSLKNGKAPTNHASAATTYGVGSSTAYGHVKVSDSYAAAGAAGTAASQKAAFCIHTDLQNYKKSANSALGGKAPTNHASTGTGYGVGNASNYGHVKVSDTYTSLVSGSGIAASQKAAFCLYTALQSAGSSPYNQNPKGLGVANPGSSPNYARGDHVHPLQCTGWRHCVRHKIVTNNTTWLPQAGCCFALPTCIDLRNYVGLYYCIYGFCLRFYNEDNYKVSGNMEVFAPASVYLDTNLTSQQRVHAISEIISGKYAYMGNCICQYLYEQSIEYMELTQAARCGAHIDSVMPHVFGECSFNTLNTKLTYETLPHVNLNIRMGYYISKGTLSIEGVVKEECRSKLGL